MSDVTIGPLEDGDKGAWRRLYDGYADFYKVPMDDARAETLWGWLMDPAHVLTGLVARAEGEPVGLAHFRDMPSPLRGAVIGFLDDLYVDPAWRGSGAARALLEAVAEEGRRRGWPFYRWITQDDNYRARGLYDRMAMRTMWITYQYDLG